MLVNQVQFDLICALYELLVIDEGRPASKSPSKKFGYFLPISRQDVSADIIQNSAVGNFSQKTEGTKTKATRCVFSDVFSLPGHFECFAIFSYCEHFAKFVCLLKRLQRLKQEWQ
jgi:hypothetical protein